MHQTNNFFGKSGFYHFFGIVEDRLDPEKLGRLRVRCFGVHTDNKAELPTEHLPWAQVILPLDSSPNAIPNTWEGDMVFGFFADGVSMQVPVILGSVSSKMSKSDPMLGFSDPRPAGVVAKPGESPTTYNSKVGSNISPAITGAGYAESHVGKNKVPATDVVLPGGATTSEVANPYAAQYPYNHAEETESGHVVEYDDTPGAERIHIMHRTGTFVEMHPDGSLVIKSTKNSNSYTVGSDLKFVKGTIITSNNESQSHRSGKEFSITADSGNINITASSGDFNLNVTGNVNVNASGQINMTAPKINLNG